MNQALRLARPVLIGCGGAVVVWGTVFALQQQAAVASGNQQVHLSREWALDTKSHITRAAGAFTPDQKAAEYEKALNTLVTKRTDVRTKSADWLTGYADLLRALGVALYDDGQIDQAKEALEASMSIPLGNDLLRSQAAVALFRIGNRTEPQYLLDATQASSLTNARPKANFETEQQVRARVPVYMEIAKLLIDKKQYTSALNSLIALHRAFSIPANSDPLCYKPSTGGYIGQVLWQLGKKEDAVAWLQISEADAALCRTPACKEVRETLRALLAKTNK